MSAIALNWVEDLPLKPAKKAVMLLLAKRANKHNQSWRSAATIARQLDCSKRYVQDVLDSLEADELITTEARHDKRGRQSSNRYTLAVPKSEKKLSESEQIELWKGDPEQFLEDFQRDCNGAEVAALMTKYGAFLELKSPSEVGM